MGDLSKHFSAWEFECHCGKCESKPMSLSLLLALELLHISLSAEHKQEIVIKITSGYRCLEYNATIPGASPRSKHLQSIAADIQCYAISDNSQKAKVQIPPDHCASAINSLFPYSLGVGRYDDFTHVDARDRCVRWDFRSGK